MVEVKTRFFARFDDVLPLFQCAFFGRLPSTNKCLFSFSSDHPILNFAHRQWIVKKNSYDLLNTSSDLNSYTVSEHY